MRFQADFRYKFNSCSRNIDGDFLSFFIKKSQLLFAMLALIMFCMNTATAQTPSAKTFDLQGHRGARGLLPENTLPAFEKALAIGVTTLELDVGVTRDGFVVISHDRSLNPEITRDAASAFIAQPVLVFTQTLAQISAFDVGRINPASPYATRFASQQPIDGTRMPTLAQLFERTKALGAHAVRFNIETKISPEKPQETVSPEAFVNALLAVIDAYGMRERVTVQSFDWRTLELVLARHPGMSVAFLSAEQSWTNNVRERPPTEPNWTGQVRASQHTDTPSLVRAAAQTASGPAANAIWSPYFADAPKHLVEKAQSLGLKVIPWTANEPKHIEAVIDTGADGLITDYPDRARAILQKRGIAVAAPLR